MSVVRKRTGRTARWITCLAAAAVLALPAAAVADPFFTLKTTVTITGVPLNSFDISFVDPDLHAYLLADRSNQQIDVIDTITKSQGKLDHGGFVGLPASCSGAAPGSSANDCAGPNGVLTVHKGDGDHDADDRNSAEVWAGDGNSSVVVLSYPSGALVTRIPTGGKGRADEACWDPEDHLVLFANDAEADFGQAPFISFISTDTHKIVKQIKFDGLAGDGPNATNGIEQCQWNPREHAFYLNLPQVGGTPGTDTTDGNVVVINPHSLKIVRAFDIPATQCAGPQGMAIGPAPQILLGCNAASVPPGTGQNAGIMNEDTGKLIQVLSNQGGNDEVWFNPRNGLYFLAEGSNAAQEQLGIVASYRPNKTQDIVISSPPGKGHPHSVAADPFSGEVYFPIPNNADSPTNTAPNPCPSPTDGCIAIYWAQYPQYSQWSH